MKIKLKAIIRWGWNLLFVYLIFVMIMIWQDAKANPELFILVEERPTDSTIPPNDSILIVPNSFSGPQEWEYKANTFQECKPMVHLLDIYNRWIQPMIFVMVILVVLNIIVNLKWKKGNVK